MTRKSMPRLAALWVLLPALALGAPACSDDDGDVCDNVVNPCDTVDTVSCLGNTVQTCTENVNGCLEWADTETCDTGDTCTDGECVCANECATGASQCDGDMIQLCAMGADGCYEWADDTDCADSGESCDDTSDAICVTGAGCGNDVREGTELCDGDDLDDQTCEDENFGPGTLACNDTCDGYITTGCSAAADCGNDTIESPEVCDGTDLDSEDCTDHGFDEGTLGCASNCGSFDTSSCTYFDPGITCAAATDISSATFPFTLTGTFDDDPTVGFSCDASATNVVWYEYTPTTTGNYSIDATNNTTDWAYSRLVVLDGTGCAPYDTELLCLEVEDYVANGSISLTGGNTYLIAFFTDGDDYSMTNPEIHITYYPSIPGDTCANAEDLTSATFPHSLTGTFPLEPATGFSCDTTATNVVWYEFTPSTSAIYTIDATNNSADWAYSRLVLLDGTGCAPYDTELFCETSYYETASGSTFLEGGNTYLIAFFTDEAYISMEDPEIYISSVAVDAGDVCQAPIDISSETFPHQVSGTFDEDPTTSFSCGIPATNTVWFEYTPTTTGDYAVGATNATTDNAWSRLVVLEGTSCAPYDTELACVVDNTGLSAMTTVTLTAGTTYLIAFFTDDDEYTMVDPTITVSPSYTIGGCNLQDPVTYTGDEYTSVMTYGQLYIAGLTDATTGPDANAAIIAEVGAGPDGSDPTTDFADWDWYPTVINTAYVDSSDDEYMGNLILPAGAGSPYDMAYRVSGDGGLSWTYCDTVDTPYTIADAGDLTVTVPPDTLIISEYIEGSSDNKALEFYNATAADIDLSTCQVLSYVNGSSTPAATVYTFPAVNLAAGNTYVVCNTASNATLQAYCDELNLAATNFNGNDAMELYCGGVLVDSIGQVGDNPGAFWGTAPTRTLNATLRRDGSRTYGDTDSSDAYDPATEWSGYAQDTFDGLGTHP